MNGVLGFLAVFGLCYFGAITAHWHMARRLERLAAVFRNTRHMPGIDMAHEAIDHALRFFTFGLLSTNPKRRDFNPKPPPFPSEAGIGEITDLPLWKHWLGPDDTMSGAELSNFLEDIYDLSNAEKRALLDLSLREILEALQDFREKEGCCTICGHGLPVDYPTDSLGQRSGPAEPGRWCANEACPVGPEEWED